MRSALELPPDFAPVTVDMPHRLGDSMGYVRGARFVGFYWEPKSGPIWDDGEPFQADRVGWYTFVRTFTSLTDVYEVNLGSSISEATHVLIWDRERQAGYLAPRHSAISFLHLQQNGQVGSKPLIG
jgi:hypothetical protein